MRLKTFFSQSMQQAMIQIRKELGAEAVIISTLQEKNGVRVTAAIDHTVPQPLVHESTTPALSTIDTFLQLIERQRLPREISETILASVSRLDPAIIQQGIAKTLEQLFSFSPLPHPWAAKGGAPHPFMLIGPTGAGKTLATAKLAVEYLLAGWRVAIITMDGEKAGAHAQLSRFAEALRIPVAFAQDAEELHHYLENDYADHLVFVDTTGLNITNQKDLQILSELTCVIRYSPILVMPAGLDVYEALDLAEVAKELGVTRFIHTKVDCSQRFGAMLGVMSEGGLQLASLGCGPELGIRLKPASATVMADLLNAHLPNTSANNQNHSFSFNAQVQEACL